jgi:hypothetical protein
VSTKSAAGKIKTGINEAVGQAVEISEFHHSRMALPRFNISSARNEQSYQVHVRALGFIRPLRNAKCQSEHSITL